MEPRVGIAHIEITAADGTFAIGREAFPDFERYARLGVHIQSDHVRIATPPAAYLEAALTALADACRELGVAHADVAFVDTVVAPPRFGLRYGFKGAYTTDRPEVISVPAKTMISPATVAVSPATGENRACQRLLPVARSTAKSPRSLGT